MLRNIKSSFFIKKMFLELQEKKKLDLIKYNKNFQKLLDKDILNFRKLSKKYIIIEKNGTRKNTIIIMMK